MTGSKGHPSFRFDELYSILYLILISILVDTVSTLYQDKQDLHRVFKVPLFLIFDSF